MPNSWQEGDWNRPSVLLENGRELIGMKDFVVLTDQDVKRLFRSTNICPIIVMGSKVCCQGVDRLEQITMLCSRPSFL